ncbi:MAG TPA: zinc-ribbon domain-containing protein [Pyrinomonadaceae bacterium]|nr:zinc-ribbon domain-containing protein [Pyrinomonadaceae bacterium]
MDRVKSLSPKEAKHMYCPKCGLQNADETKFCRGCGADVSNVPAAIEVRRTGDLALAEKQIDLYGSGLRGVLIGAGFLFSSAVAFAVSMRVAVLALFFLAFASYFLGTGISRMFQARALKRLLAERDPQPAAVQKPALPDSENAPPSFYETDDLAQLPSTVTEHTTRHLEERKRNT